MINKLTCVGVIALSSAMISSTALAHVKNGALVDGSGNAVSASYDKCVIVASGKHSSKCQDIKPKKVAPAPKPVVKPAPVPPPAPKPVRVQKAFTLAGDALFATNSAELSAEGRSALDKFVSDLNAASNLQVSKISVVGHADSRGNDAYNQKLSERRAATVGNYLVSKGISSSLIETSGRGEADPIASNATSEGRAKNRRVELGLSGIQVYTK